jgi:hypothetical protein
METLIQSNFKEWTLDKIDDAFGLYQEFNMLLLNQLLTHTHTFDDFEILYLKKLQSHFMLGGDDWNEVELENKFISPMIVFASSPDRRFSYFLERDLSIEINNYMLSGRVDGIVASGFRNPKKPYFCLNEYKRGTDPNGDPKGQALIAMLVAQKLNNNQFPIFGCYIIGRSWCFMALKDNRYAISTDYSCADDEIFDIYRILKGLNAHIDNLLTNEQN